MAQYFHENAHNRIDPKKYAEGWERVFGKKEKNESDTPVSENGEKLLRSTNSEGDSSDRGNEESLEMDGGES